MFSQLLRFEALYQVKQKAFLIFSLIFLGYGLLAGSQGFAPTNVNFNSSYQIYFFTGLFTLGSVFIIIFFAISGMLRDKQHRMEHLIYSTAVSKSSLFWSRFLGMFLFSLLAFTPMLIGFALGVSFSNLDPERMGSFELLSYLKTWLMIAVPNIFICSAIIFAVSALTKNNIATYVSSIFIYMLYMISAIFLNSPLMAQSVPASPETMMMAALADPFGISAFFEQTQFWTPYQKNTELLSFSGLYMWNRLIWMFVSFGILGVTYRLFSFRKLSQKVKGAVETEEEQTVIKKYTPVQSSVGNKSQAQAFFSLLKIELSGIVKSLPFLCVMIIWLVIVFMEIFSRIYEGGAYNDSWYPLTNLLIELVVDPLTLLAVIPIVFYSGELVWRERNVNINEIIDATPAVNWTFFLSKFAALILLPAIMIGTAIALAISFQIVSGYYHFEIGQYLSMFYYNGMQLFIFCIIAVFVQSLIPNKYLGMGLTGIIIAISLFSPYLGIEHSMLRIGHFPRIGYNNMTGYAGETLLFNHLTFYWLGLCGILALIAFKIWQRGATSTVQFRVKEFLFKWKKWELLTVAIFFAVFIASGSTLYYNMNVVNDYMNGTDNLDYREAYERKFKKYDALERPYAVSMITEVDIYPDDNKYSVKADYMLKNKGDKAINEVFITTRVPLTSISLENAELLEYDKEFETYLFGLNTPMEPQAELNFTYELTQELKGYETNEAIASNGTYLTHRDFQPVLAYRGGLQISNNYEREKRGLAKIEEEKATDAHLGLNEASYGRVSFETIVSTTSDQIALSSGALIREWSENGRNYFHYKPEVNIVPTMGYFSARYEVLKEEYNGIEIEQYFQPDHAYNIDSMMESTKRALDYCRVNFGEYPFAQMRLAEIPAHWGFGGFAHPGVISMVEDNLYLIDIRDADDFNLVAKRTIHEVAHQWWGHILVPKMVYGGSIFVEGFAKYTEAAIMESMYGKRAVFQLSETANTRYFSGRAFASSPEPPLYLVDDQSYLSYGKNYTVMLALKGLIGEAKVNQVLRTLADRYRNSDEFEVTTLDFMDELYKVTPVAHHVLIDDWFKRVITYDLAIGETSYQELDNGQYEITLEVISNRFETKESGESLAIGINEPISIGLFAEHPSEVSNETPILYLQPHLINQENLEFKIVVDELPNYVSIDPYGTRSDENLIDNIVRL